MTLQVSWVRHRDVHLLTIGRYTYTNDQRFRAIHNAHSDDWTLQIKYPQHRDSGIYECQVSTTPHMSHLVHLNVIGKLFRQFYVEQPIKFALRNGKQIAFRFSILSIVRRHDCVPRNRFNFLPCDIPRLGFYQILVCGEHAGILPNYDGVRNN